MNHESHLLSILFRKPSMRQNVQLVGRKMLYRNPSSPSGNLNPTPVSTVLFSSVLTESRLNVHRPNFQCPVSYSWNI